MTSESKGKSRKALGRGLEALLPGADQSSLREVHIDRIEPNPNQPRERFELKALEDLASSIREHGVVQPLLVYAAGDDRYHLIVGERRWRAARMAGLERVPVVVKDASDRQTLELALVENLQRADLNPLEEAAAYQRLLQEYGLTQQEVASRVGKSRVAVANTVRLLALSDDLKRAVMEQRISEGHARALLSVPGQQDQLAILLRVERDDLSVRRTEELVRRVLEPRPGRSKLRIRSPDIESVEKELQRALGSKVTLRSSKRGGRIVIEYSTDEEFQGLYERLIQRG